MALPGVALALLKTEQPVIHLKLLLGCCGESGAQEGEAGIVQQLATFSWTGHWRQDRGVICPQPLGSKSATKEGIGGFSAACSLSLSMLRTRKPAFLSAQNYSVGHEPCHFPSIILFPKLALIEACFGWELNYLTANW